MSKEYQILSEGPFLSHPDMITQSEQRFGAQHSNPAHGKVYGALRYCQTISKY